MQEFFVATFSDILISFRRHRNNADILPGERLLIQYGDQIQEKTSLGRMIATNSAYSMAKTPILREGNGTMPNPDHRVVQDDIGWGLCVLMSIAESLEQSLGRTIPRNMMRMCVEWHQWIMKKEFLVNGKLTGKDCGELVLITDNDPYSLVTGSGRNMTQRKQPDTGELKFSSLS